MTEKQNFKNIRTSLCSYCPFENINVYFVQLWPSGLRRRTQVQWL